MLKTSAFAIVAATVFGFASAALADEHFDLNIYRPAVQSPAFATYMGALAAHAQVRPTMTHTQSIEEMRLFAKGSYAGW
jgi:hypothetical protein